MFVFWLWVEKGGSLQDTIFCVFFFNSPVSSSSSSCSSSNNQLIKKTNIIGSVSLCVCVLRCEWVFVCECVCCSSPRSSSLASIPTVRSRTASFSLLSGLRVGTLVPEMWEFPALSLNFTLFGKYLWNKQKKISVPLCFTSRRLLLRRRRRFRHFEHLGIRIVRFAKGARHCPSFLP